MINNILNPQSDCFSTNINEHPSDLPGEQPNEIACSFNDLPDDLLFMITEELKGDSRSMEALMGTSRRTRAVALDILKRLPSSEIRQMFQYKGNWESIIDSHMVIAHPSGSYIFPKSMSAGLAARIAGRIGNGGEISGFCKAENSEETLHRRGNGHGTASFSIPYDSTRTLRELEILARFPKPIQTFYVRN